MTFTARLKEEWKKMQDQFRDQIWEHEEIVKIRNQFSELEPKTQQAITAGAIGFAISLVIGLLVYLGFNSYALQSKMAEMDDEIHYIQASNEKMDQLRRKILEQQNADPLTRDLDKSASLAQFAEQVAKKAAITKENIEVSDKQASKTESNIELKLNKISLRQLLRILFVFENAKNGVNITKVESDSKNDPEGYLWVIIGLQKKLAVANTTKSTFTR